MKLLRSSIRYNFIKQKKFNQVDYDNNFSNDPQQDIFTKFMNKTKPNSFSFNNIVENNIQKTQNFRLSRQKYLEIQKNNQTGCIYKFTYKNVDFTLVSTNINFVPPTTSIYKLLQKQSPDLLFLQVRPDFILNGFVLNKKKNDIFSDSLYFKQILRTGFDIMPSKLDRQKVSRNLRKGGVHTKQLKSPYKQIYQEQIKKQYDHFNSRETLNNQTLSILAHFSQVYQTPLVLGQLPQISQRQFIVNSNTLMQLQQIFKVCCRQLAIYSTNPKIISNFLFPQIMLHYGDRYMATLIQYIIALKQYKNIAMFVGIAQNQSIVQYLMNRSISTIIEDIMPQKPKNYLTRDIQNYEIIEKHCLLDVMQYGQNILKTELLRFKTTTAMINFYADPHKVDRHMYQKLQLFRIQMYTKYLKLLNNELKIGQQRKNKQFLRNVI